MKSSSKIIYSRSSPVKKLESFPLKKEVSVVIPVYQEAENLEYLIPEIDRVLVESEVSYELIIVDDNSQDGTEELIEKLGSEFPLNLIVREVEPRSLEQSVLKGLSLAKNSVSVVMDADFSHPPAFLPEMIMPIVSGDADITVGSRYMKGGGIENWSFLRRVSSRASGFLAKGISKLTDPTSGFMAVRSSLVSDLPVNPKSWKVVLEFVTRLDGRVKEVPIVFCDRRFGESKLDNGAKLAYLRHLWSLYELRLPTVMELVKFCFVGLFGLTVDTTVLIALVEGFGVGHLLAASLAFGVAVSCNYFLNRFWTFRKKEVESLLGSFFSYVSVCGIGLLVRLLVMSLLLSSAFNSGEKFYLLASFMGVATATIFNFIGSKVFAFAR